MITSCKSFSIRNSLLANVEIKILISCSANVMSLDKCSIGTVCDTMTLYAYLIGLLELNFVYWIYANKRSLLLSNFCGVNIHDFSSKMDTNTFMKCAFMP